MHTDGTKDASSEGPRYEGAGPALDKALKQAGSLIATGTKAALKAAVEALKDEVEDLDIDWDRFGTDPVEASKLLELLNPVLEQSNLDVRVYTLNDLQTLWSDIGERGRAAAAGGTGAVACYIGVEAVLVKATKGKSLKAANRHAVAGLLSAVCGGLTPQVPVPDPSDDSSDDDGSSTPQTPTPTTQPPTPTTTQPPFDSADCHTWLEAIRTCIKIDERDGMVTITRH